MTDRTESEVIEPEVLPPEGDADRRRARAEKWQRITGAALAGLLLDLIDFASYGPIGRTYGAVAGAAMGFYIASVFKVPMPHRVWWMAGAALYCAMPRTEFFPLATLFVVVKAVRRERLRIQ